MADNDRPNEDAPRNTAPSLRLPKAGFGKVREIVDGSRQMSGSASAAVIADQIGRTAKGQAWTDRWGTVQYLGFVAKTETGKYDITDLGRRFLDENEEDAARAAQEALMRTGFGPLIKRFGTGAPNVKAITNVLVSDCGVPEAAATKAAELLVEMATESRLVVDGRFKPAEIERAVEATGEDIAMPPAAGGTKPSSVTPATSKPPVTPKSTVPAPKPASTSTASTPARSTPAPNGGGAAPVPFDLGPTVILNIDATRLTATEIAEIVRELRKQAASS